jgi:cytochrome c-type biogenesis protein CcmH/NrfG
VGVVIARIAMLVTAVAAIVALILWLDGVRQFEQARDVGLAARTPAEIDRAVTLFERADRRSPDTLPETGEAFLLIRAKRQAQAEAILRDVLIREPRNVTAWGLLALALDGRDPDGAAAARERVSQLSPPVAEPG